MEFKRQQFRKNRLGSDIFVADDLAAASNLLSLITRQIENLKYTNQPNFLAGKYHQLCAKRDRLISYLEGGGEDQEDDTDEPQGV